MAIFIFFLSPDDISGGKKSPQIYRPHECPTHTFKDMEILHNLVKVNKSNYSQKKLFLNHLTQLVIMLLIFLLKMMEY